MFIYKKSEKGQAIVLIALAIVGLIGITALAIDGGNAYSDRRHAQTAADNASLAGALAKVSPPASVNSAAYEITTKNGYENAQVTLIDGGPFVNCRGDTLNPVDATDPHDALSQYFEVMIHTSVNTYFGPVVGIPQLKNCVYSIARGQPSRFEEWFTGQAIAGLNCTDQRTIDISGAVDVKVTGGGIYSNSDSTAPSGSLYINDSDSLQDPKPPISAAGGGRINADGMIGPNNATPYTCPLPAEMLPPTPIADLCDYTYHDFPPDHTDAHVNVDVDPIEIQPGNYCITGVMGNPDMDGTDVSFVLINEGLSWSSNTAYIHLSAPTDINNPLNHILIYAPYGNTNTLKFNGTAEMVITGTIFAPDALISLQGDFTGASIDSQWLGNKVEMTGSLVGNFNYDDQTRHIYQVPPKIELTR